ncbi:MAG: N-acetylmuramic acid 6-phosphate etherase [Candidatus Latescibacterota bacterium]|nr:N-acetylmuramic acid 6-phosphate etherase [Candidatus Latescibacterota bacterium]
MDWSRLLTEQRNPRTENIDELDTLDLVRMLNREDAEVAGAVELVLPELARAVDAVVGAFESGGRLLYLGAGTSGRLGILDASECPPTYGVSPEMVQGLIAGGERAVFRAVEGAEDDPQGAVAALEERGLSSDDIVMGIAASGVTPWVLGGLHHARKQGCATILFSCSPSAAQSTEVDIRIVPEVGPEAVTGSTRMKAGTATKFVLNTLTTAAMIRLGKTYGNLMVDLQSTNNKLRDRSLRILSTLAEIDATTAKARLQATSWNLKLALVSELCEVDVNRARHLLAGQGGRVKAAVLSGRGEGEMGKV